MHRREFVLSATGIVGATTVGSVAYTSATVERDVTAAVAADSSGIIKLEGNTNIPAVSQNSDSQLEIDVTESLNTDGSFEYGDYSSPGSTQDTNEAFTITNADNEPRDITVSTSATSGDLSIQLEDANSNKKEVTTSTPGKYTEVAQDASIFCCVE